MISRALSAFLTQAWGFSDAAREKRSPEPSQVFPVPGYASAGRCSQGGLEEWIHDGREKEVVVGLEHSSPRGGYRRRCARGKAFGPVESDPAEQGAFDGTDGLGAGDEHGTDLS